MYCPNCGKEIADDTAVCPYCEKKLNVISDAGGENPKSRKCVSKITIALCAVIVISVITSIICFTMAFITRPTGASNVNEQNATSYVTTDKHLFSVDITFSDPLLGLMNMSDYTQEDFERTLGTNKVVFNEDGSVTINISKHHYKEVLENAIADIEKTLDELVEGSHTPYIKATEYNKDFSVITFKVDRSEFEKSSDTSAFTVGVPAIMYQLFQGTDPHVDVRILNIDTGESIKTVSFPDALEPLLALSQIGNAMNDDMAQAEASFIPGNQVLMDDHGVKITYIGMKNDWMMDNQFHLMIKIENNLDSEISVRQDSTSVNGEMVNSVLASDCSVAPGKFSEGYFYVDGNVEDVTEISTKIIVMYGADKNYKQLCETDYITIVP